MYIYDRRQIVEYCIVELPLSGMTFLRTDVGKSIHGLADDAVIYSVAGRLADVARQQYTLHKNVYQRSVRFSLANCLECYTKPKR